MSTQNQIQNADMLSKLHESITVAKSSLSAMEKWVEMLAEANGTELNNIKQKVSEIPQAHLGKEKIIEGVFDGQNMIAPNEKKYPVPPNYASKSKLVQGDKLKLTIQPNGAFVYKQIELVPRKLVVGHLILDGSQYKVLAEGKEYNVLYASVTFYRAQVGDEVTIIVPEETSTSWAAIENILPSGPDKTEIE